MLRLKLSLLKLEKKGGEENTGQEENRGKGLRKQLDVIFKGDPLVTKQQVQWEVHWAAHLGETLMQHNPLFQIISLAEISRQTSSR